MSHHPQTGEENVGAEAATAISSRLLLGCARAAEALCAAASFTEGCVFSLRILGESSGVDRVSLYQFQAEAGESVLSPTMVHEWRRDRRNPDFGYLEPGEQEIIRWRRLLESSDLVTESLPSPDGESPSTDLPSLRSLVAVPVERDGALWGFLRMDSFHRELLWLEADEIAVRAFCHFLGVRLSTESQQSEGNAPVAISLEQLSRSQEIAFQLDERGNWLFLSPAWDLLTGIPAARVIGKHHSRSLRRPAADGDSPSRQVDITAGLDPSATRAGELLLLADDESEIWVSYVLMKLPETDQNPAAFQGVLVDIRDKKLHEDQERQVAQELAGKNAELLEALVAAQEAMRLKSKFLATISHEIRTPLNGVLGMNALLLRSSLDRRQREYAEAIRSSGESLLAIVSSILDYAKLEARHVDPEQIQFDPTALVDEVFQSLAEPAARKRIDLVFTPRYPVPASLVGDSGKIRQILLNLVGNAIKFSSRGEVGVRLRWTSLVDNYGELRFEVIDRGIGIAPESLQGLFRPFSQAEPGISRIYGGTGLGLAICKQLCDLMGGEIDVESASGVGSRFRVVLRVRQAGEASFASPKDWAGPHIQGRRILLANLNEFANQSWSNVLQLASARVTSAGNLRETIAMLAAEDSESQSDVVIFDTQGLEGSGPEIHRQLRLSARNPNLMIVLLDSVHDAVDRSLLAGVQPLIILRKPISMRRALEHLAVALDSRSAVPRRPGRRAETTEPGPEAQGTRVTLLASTEGRRRVLTYLLHQFGFAVDTVEGLGDLLELSRAGGAGVVLLDRDLDDAVQLDAAERLSSGFGHGAPVVLAAASSAHSMETLRGSGVFHTVLEPSFQREALREAINRAVPKRNALRMSAS